MSGTLGYLLQQNAKAATKPTKGAKKDSTEDISAVSNLFSKEAPVLAEPVIIEDEEGKQGDSENPFLEENMTAKQKKDRDDRTIFAGNIALSATGSQISKEFKEYGKIEKIWIRSVPIETTNRMPTKAAVILKKFKEGVDTKNAYILFSTLEDAEKALQANGKLFMEKHLRVDKANEKILDYTRTAFIGNLPFNVSEEQVRAHFEDCGDILNVRVIRDPITHSGKGFGYVFFKEKEAFKLSLQKNGTTLSKRELRVKKAVPFERLEKKREKVAEKVEQINTNNALKRLNKKMEGKALVKDNNNEAAMDIEKPQKKTKKNDDGSHVRNFKSMANVSFNDNENGNFDFKNEMSIAPRILRKKIKKLSKKGVSQTASFTKVQQLKKTRKINNDKNIFNTKFTMEARREKRFIRSQQNAKKQKLETKKEDRRDKKKEKKTRPSKP